MRTLLLMGYVAKNDPKHYRISTSGSAIGVAGMLHLMRLKVNAAVRA